MSLRLDAAKLKNFTVQTWREGYPISFLASAALHGLVFLLIIGLYPHFIRPSLRSSSMQVELIHLRIEGKADAAKTATRVAVRSNVASKPVATPVAPITEAPAASPENSEASVAPAGDAIATGAQVASLATAAATAGSGVAPSIASARPRYDLNPKPPYPRLARRQEFQGTVILAVDVEPDGSVARAQVKQSSGYAILDQSALDTVASSWRFIPACRDGRAVSCRVEVPISFLLK